MSGQAQEPAGPPALCSAGCGFFANVGTGGLCSKCHREAAKVAQQQQQAPSAIMPASAEAAAAPEPAAAAAPSTSALVAPPSPSPAPAPAAPVEEPAAATTSASPAPPAKQPSPTRCFTCNKKVGLTGFSCKCQPDAVFCSTHRYAEAHACAFDYKSLQKQRLEAHNPQVQASKVQKI